MLNEFSVEVLFWSLWWTNGIKRHELRHLTQFKISVAHILRSVGGIHVFILITGQMYVVWLHVCVFPAATGEQLIASDISVMCQFRRIKGLRSQNGRNPSQRRRNRKPVDLSDPQREAAVSQESRWFDLHVELPVMRKMNLRLQRDCFWLAGCTSGPLKSECVNDWVNVSCIGKHFKWSIDWRGAINITGH